MLNELLVGRGALFKASHSAAEDFADGQVVCLELLGSVGERHLNNLDLLFLELLYGVVVDLVARENDLSTGIDDAVYVGFSRCAEIGCNGKVALVNLGASADDLAVIVHVRDDVRSRRVENYDSLGFLVDRNIRDSDGIVAVAAASEDYRRGADHNCREKNGNNSFHI